jgi:hypothetical protein
MSKDANTGHFIAQIPGQNPNTLLRYRVKVAGESAARFIPAENDLRPTFSTYIHDAWPKAKIPLGFIIHAAQPRGIRGFLGGARGQGEAGDARPPRGTSAFVYVDEKTGKTKLFDHINAPERSGARGYKIHFHKDNTLNGMTAISVIFEGSERFLLAEIWPMTSIIAPATPRRLLISCGCCRWPPRGLSPDDRKSQSLLSPPQQAR